MSSSTSVSTEVETSNKQNQLYKPQKHQRRIPEATEEEISRRDARMEEINTLIKSPFYMVELDEYEYDGQYWRCMVCEIGFNIVGNLQHNMKDAHNFCVNVKAGCPERGGRQVVRVRSEVKKKVITYLNLTPEAQLRQQQLIQKKKNAKLTVIRKFSINQLERFYNSNVGRCVGPVASVKRKYFANYADKISAFCNGIYEILDVTDAIPCCAAAIEACLLRSAICSLII